MAELSAAFLTIFVVVALVAFSKWRDLYAMRELNRLVAWSVTTNYHAIGAVRPGLDLIDYVRNVQFVQKLETNYCINSDTEIQMAKDILNEFQRTLIQEYFNEKLSFHRSKYADDGEHFFFAHLFDFLKKHECDYDFVGNDMHTQRLSYKQYGQSFSSGSDSTYQLSVFGIVFHKLYYISYLFCRDSRIYGDRMPSWVTEKFFTDILDSNEITIYSKPY